MILMVLVFICGIFIYLYCKVRSSSKKKGDEVDVNHIYDQETVQQETLDEELKNE